MRTSKMRREIELKKGWVFTGRDGKAVKVDLPHTWNAVDGQDGGNDYYRGTCHYSTTFAAPDFDSKTQRVYLEFQGVNSSAEVDGFRTYVLLELQELKLTVYYLEHGEHPVFD